MKKIIFGENKNIIHENLLLCRRKAGLSQEQLAAKMQVLGANIDQQMISRIERNCRIVTDYELACLCSILGISADKMLNTNKPEK